MASRRDEILRRLDLVAEFQKHGGRIPPGARPNADGWLPVHAIDREDKKPSAALNVGDDPNKRGRYVDHGTQQGCSFFDLISRMPGTPFITGRDVYHHYGRQTGVLADKKSSSNKKSGVNKGNGKIVATYDYFSPTGNLLFQVCRMEPKRFLQRRPDGMGGWVWNMNGVEPVLYHLPSLAAAALVYIVEGERDVGTLTALGLTATCNAGGAGKWRASYNKALQGKAVVILPDNDDPGRSHAQTVARNLHGVAASIKVVELPGLPQKGDVSDWLDSGGTPEQLRSLMQDAPEWDLAKEQSPGGSSGVNAGQEFHRSCGSIYSVKDGSLCLVIQHEDGTDFKPLCDFAVEITAELSKDDGSGRVSKEFLIKGQTKGGQDLPPAQASAKEFDGMGWIRREWGTRVSLNAERKYYSHLPNAILARSQGLGIEQRKIFTHSGWRLINGAWRYLHGGGAIGDDDPVEVNLGENLGNYRLPAPGELEAAQASLEFLEIGSWEITAPLLACAYLAPFADLLKIDFSLWLYGPTGSMKSTIAALSLCHFGYFSRTTLPGSWFSTVNSLEKLCFTLKDSLVVIDDFMPPTNAKEAHRMSEAAARLIYQLGNRSGRGRLAADLSARPDHRPRCLILSTGEMLLPGQRQSATSRFLGVELDPKKTPIDLDRLTAAQAKSHLYSAAMSTYLTYLAPRLEDAQEELRDLWEGYRNAFRGTTHKRIPETQAWLAVGFEMFLRFQARMGAISESQANEMLLRAWKVFESLGEKHSRIIEGEHPTLKFLAVLQELFLSGRAYVQSAAVTGAPPTRSGELGWVGADPARNSELIGWADDVNLYLMPETVFRMVHETVARQGSFLSLGKNELLSALTRERLIEPGGKGENTRVKWLNGSSKRVICMPLKNLFPDEESSGGGGGGNE